MSGEISGDHSQKVIRRSKRKQNLTALDPALTSKKRHSVRPDPKTSISPEVKKMSRLSLGPQSGTTAANPPVDEPMAEQAPSTSVQLQ